MSATIRTTVRGLRDWIAPVLKTIGTDEYLPVLCHARLEVGPRHALLITTDRFACSVSRVRWDDKHPAAKPVTVHIHRDNLSRVLQTFRARGRANPDVRVEVTAKEVRFIGHDHTLVAPTLEHASASAPVPQVGPVNYPDVKRLVRDAATWDDDAPAFGGVMSVDFHRLADLRAAAPKREAVLIRQAPGGPGKPYVLRMGEDYIALLMPRRAMDPDNAPSITDGWDDALAADTTTTKETA
ncbi:hypothetical protein NYO98_10630 [Nocardioides sp. STR2]|uniref:DNA polymerase III beta sliding clamp central domain-containing protein n=1 Tax=Nocardioides pini TaxID=2975053 RepID=A0ABT4CFJ1_9ACTN|nr:hypothetical protein [Nocardioides pini]MCY4726734.1 hypothetical protein [Nocardioides pini]